MERPWRLVSAGSPLQQLLGQGILGKKTASSQRWIAYHICLLSSMWSMRGLVFVLDYILTD